MCTYKYILHFKKLKISEPNVFVSLKYIKLLFKSYLKYSKNYRNGTLLTEVYL